ncbi:MULTISPECIES: adenylate/guanylate cyclase domain-containing protein [Bradyrhizobium]|uniref:Adenylate cyclase n=2 Tax=Bradyrhizobium TaxID=374 RepID=A0ABY0P5W4_9BRAD|nr:MULTISPECIES: adenylate/guanylate cyclase domain-containing protein [Bradyrhizobium]SDH43797.1 adenylate cyclase [Bradyrhizobium ottawaense]SEE32115.1 adenylate cyclase [Bradyrhizobium lablabi]
MTDNRVERRLAAILAADVAGYSRLTGSDEEGTHVRLRERLRGLADPKISEHRGKVVKHTGDGVLAEFGSVVDAVRCAIEVQRGMAEQNATIPQVKRIEFRIGIHVGDIIVDDNDIFGDGVNIAARLEGIAEPGGVCISDDAQRQIRGKVDTAFEDIGPQILKNIAEPMRAWRFRMNASGSAAAPIEPPVDSTQAPALPDKPSIAVLPFENMSGDPEQEYFADGMVEEIITALSRFKWLFVIARNSSFTFKGKAVDIKEIGRRLGVRYVLEGSVRKAAGKVRITGQLIDAVTGAHIWADRFERDLTDIFALQDEVTLAVVSAIQPKLFQTEIAIATRRRPENLTAYDLFLRAMQQYYATTREGLAETIRLAQRALELDPRFAFVAALAGHCHMLNVILGYAIDPQFDRKEAIRLLRLALSLDDSDPETLALAAAISAFMVGDCENEVEMAGRAVALNPNSFSAWHFRGWVYRNAGLPDEALRSFERAMRMSPLDPLLYRLYAGMGFALIELRRFDEAIAAGKKALRQNPSYSTACRCLASAFAHLGRDAEAREAAARLLEIDPAFTISAWIARAVQSNSKLLIEGLRKAGLPE